MKYTLAIDIPTHNCSDTTGHGYVILRNKEAIKGIRKQYPKLTLALWRCSKCGKVKESM